VRKRCRSAPPPSAPAGLKVFLSHNWSDDLLGRNNHERVKRVNAMLKERGVATWFDEQGDMQGDTLLAMTSGIDECDIILVFLTRDYIKKVNKQDNDNCKLEFQYAYGRKGGKCMLPIVMEQDVRSSNSWDGPVGAVLNSHLYKDLSPTDISAALVDDLVAEIRRLQSSLPTKQRPMRLRLKCTKGSAKVTVSQW
jgi:hypothetical protein